ncbi:UDP-N-acetylglucosamine 2-epimerase, partial [Pseudomonas putida]
MANTVMMVFGTRPEAIKMAPLARVLREWPDIDLHICSTGQHREMLEQVLTAFGLSVDQDLKVMTQNQTLNGLARDLLDSIDKAYERVRPE